MDFNKYRDAPNHEVLNIEGEGNFKNFEIEGGSQIFSQNSPTIDKKSEIPEVNISFINTYKEDSNFISENTDNFYTQILILISLLGFSFMFLSFIFLFDLKNNGNIFLFMMILGSMSIPIFMIFYRGSECIYCFFKKKNIGSICLSYLFNLYFLVFFTKNSHSFGFTLIFSISQVFFYF